MGSQSSVPPAAGGAAPRWSASAADQMMKRWLRSWFFESNATHDLRLLAPLPRCWPKSPRVEVGNEPGHARPPAPRPPHPRAAILGLRYRPARRTTWARGGETQLIFA